MPKIGILLPGSTLYPSIGIDFLQGVRSCLGFYKQSHIETIVFPVGFGIKEREIYAQVEKWLLSENVDVIILYAEDRLANVLSPLFVATRKLLLISNIGAHYPLHKSAISNTLFHSMNDCLHSYLTGKLCGQENGSETKAVVATSFYDGGYQHCHAMANGFALENGEVMFNFITPFKKESFDISSLEKFIGQNPDTNNLLCIYSGDMARVFHEHIARLQLRYDLNLYGSPLMFDNTPGDFLQETVQMSKLKGYTGWVYALDSVENRNFLNFYQDDNKKEANLFSLQGWEASLLIISYLNHRTVVDNVTDALELFRLSPIISPRGVLQINDKNTVLGPAYLVSASKDKDITVDVAIEATSDQWQEMLQQVPDTVFSAWQNTYLCI